MAFQSDIPKHIWIHSIITKCHFPRHQLHVTTYLHNLHEKRSKKSNRNTFNLTILLITYWQTILVGQLQLILFLSSSLSFTISIIIIVIYWVSCGLHQSISFHQFSVSVQLPVEHFSKRLVAQNSKCAILQE